MSEEKKGYHKGALETLLKERAELSKMLSIVNSLVEKHAQALKEAGVNVEDYIENLKDQKKEISQPKRRSKKKSSKENKKDSKGNSEMGDMLEGGNKVKGPIKSTKTNKNKGEKGKQNGEDEKGSKKEEGVDYSFK